MYACMHLYVCIGVGLCMCIICMSTKPKFATTIIEVLVEI